MCNISTIRKKVPDIQSELRAEYLQQNQVISTHLQKSHWRITRGGGVGGR